MEDNINTMSNKTILNKTCITCQKELPITEFGKRRYRSNKPTAHWLYTHYGKCKECTSISKALWRKANPMYMKEWYMKHKQLKTIENAI
jgi:hypothetical protein